MISSMQLFGRKLVKLYLGLGVTWTAMEHDIRSKQLDCYLTGEALVFAEAGICPQQ